MTKKITIAFNRNVVVFFIIGILVVVGLVFVLKGNNGKPTNSIVQVYESLSRINPNAAKLYFEQSDRLTKEVDPRLVELDQLTIGCFGANKIMQMKESDPGLGGQCCGALKNADQYRVQLDVIKDFIEEHREHLENNADFIPNDPYEVSVAHAKKLIGFDNEIKLNAEQQAIYDEAVQMSHHGGPCCCKCWKWYAMSGLAKKLIVDNDFTAEQTAELWDISSSCGHDEDVNMHEHYKKNSEHKGHDSMSSNNKIDVFAEMKTDPEDIKAQEPILITFNLKDSDGKPLKDLSISHERILHTIITSEDFSVFSHIHPEDIGPITKEIKETANYPVKFTFPSAGKYLISIDFAVYDKHASKQFIIYVNGEPLMGKLNPDFTRTFNFDSYEFNLMVPGSISAGKEITLKYHVKKGDEDVTDLEPYLGAPMHIAIVSSDLKNFLHTHGELRSSGMEHHMSNDNMALPDKFGPDIQGRVTFPTKGLYYVFGEIKHNGKVITTKFAVNVE